MAHIHLYMNNPTEGSTDGTQAMITPCHLQ